MSGPGEARTILLLHIISDRPSKQPLMVRTFLKVYMELGSCFLFLPEQKAIIIFSKSPGQAPYGALNRRVKKGGLPGTPPHSPSPRIPRCPGGLYLGSIARVRLRPELFSVIGILSGPATGFGC